MFFCRTTKPDHSGEAGTELGASNRRVLPGVEHGQHFVGLGFQVSAANSLPGPYLLGISLPSLQTAAKAKRRRSSQDPRKRAGGGRPVPAGDAEDRREAARWGGGRRRRRKAGGGGVEEPGPGSLPAYCTRKWRFPWVPERKKQSLGGFFSSPPSFSPPLLTAVPRAHTTAVSLRRWASTFSSLSCVPRVYYYSFFFFARFASVFLPFWRGAISWGF